MKRGQRATYRVAYSWSHGRDGSTPGPSGVAPCLTFEQAEAKLAALRRIAASRAASEGGHVTLTARIAPINGLNR